MSKWSKDSKNGSQAHRLSSLMMASVLMPLLSVPVFAQGEVAEEEVIVSATRRALQDALTLKRETTSISDVLASGDIGEIPSLSVAEALEAIPGATTHRLKGSGTQVSLRGLGPTLGLETFNGRTVTTGAANRSVNFQQFPSELMNKIQIFKSQSADMIEGGTSGVVELQTARPLDYGKRRVVVNMRGKYNSLATRQEGNDGLGYRGSLSYIDQFDTAAGPVGITMGYSAYDSGSPEEAFVASSTTSGCADAGLTSAQQVADLDHIDESCGNDDLITDVRDEASLNGVADQENFSDFYFLNSSAAFRNVDDVEKRRAFMGAVQWQPADEFEFNADIQLSSKDYEEARSEILFDNIRNGHYNVELDPDSYKANSWSGFSRVRLDNNLYRRVEDYRGGGLAFTYTPTDRLTLDADISYSFTHRSRNQRYVRFRTNDNVNYDFVNDGALPEITTYNLWTDGSSGEDLGVAFDSSDLSQFDTPATIRSRKRDQRSTQEAIRLDAKYDLDTSFFSSVEAGLRYSTNQRLTQQDDSQETSLEVVFARYHGGLEVDNATLRENISDACGTGPLNPSFASGTSAELQAGWAGFDTACAINLVTGGLNDEGFTNEEELAAAGISDDSGNDIDVLETVSAVYLKANFNTELAGLPLYGNFGVRALETTVESQGFDVQYSIVSCNPGDATGAGGPYEGAYGEDVCGNTLVEDLPDTTSENFWFLKRNDVLSRPFQSNTITSVLPSATAILDISDDFTIRTAVYRALSRDNIDYYRSGYTYGEDEFDDRDDFEDVVSNDILSVSTGNAFLEPYLSWNLDLSFEFYFNEESTVSVALYYKDFEASLITVVDENQPLEVSYYGHENFVNIEAGDVPDGFEACDDTLAIGVAGVCTVATDISYFSNIDQNNTLYGLELNAQTVFTFLPYPFDGLGGRLTYNYAATDYQTQDGIWGDYLDGTTGEIKESPLTNLDEGTFFGQSDHSGSLTVFWDIGPINLQWITKYRSEYLQPNLGETKSNRWIQPFTYIDFAARWRINDIFKLRATVQNAFDEPQVSSRGTISGNSSGWSSTGPKYELGLTASF